MTLMSLCSLRAGARALAGILLLAGSVGAAFAQAAEGAAGAPSGAPELPRDLTPWGMFLNADPLVKAVLIGLAFASVVTWTVWLAKSIELIWARRRLRSDFRLLMSAQRLTDGIERLTARGGPGKEFVQAAVAEIRQSAESHEPEGIKERVTSRLERIEAAFGRRIMRGTSVLATIGATAPFVGLFGTVWGIMNSFIGISREHTTNLAVVAPGIAEALLATAFGLAAAIPAVVIYNTFARSIAGYRALLGDASAAALRLVSRDLDHQAAPGRRAAPFAAESARIA
jgi:biopolymer transport protein ExbB